MLLLDTNILIYFIAGQSDMSFLDEKEIENSFVSVVSVTELLAKPDLTKKDLEFLEDFLWHLKILDINLEISKEAASLKRKYGLSFPDALIAATAKIYKLSLVSKDKAFTKITELQQIPLH